MFEGSDPGAADISGLYYKHVVIVNDDTSVVSKWNFKTIDDTRGTIYNHNMFIIQATRDNGGKGLF
jgi:hypothetical protein